MLRYASRIDITLASIREHFAFLQDPIGQCDTRIKAEIEGDETLTRKAVLLESIPGIGTTRAAVLFAELPELGIADKKQIAARAGVTPMNRNGGQWRGQAHITGGRFSVRCTLYMATLTTIRTFYNVSVPKAKRQRSPSRPPCESS